MSVCRFPGSRGTGPSPNASDRSTGRKWFISVAPPGDLSDSTRPAVEEIAAFRIPPGYLIKLHCGTWQSGPHVAGDGGLFFNLENEDTNVSDNHIVQLDQECRYML
jgi:hypothetical protein